MMSLYRQWLDYVERFHAILPELFPKKVQIRTIDSDLYLRDVRDLDSGIPVTFQLGTKIPENSGPAMALAERRIIRRFVDKSHYGVEMRTVNIPFEDNSGCISLTYNVDMEFQISHSMERIAAASEEITASSEQINKNGTIMHERFQEMTQFIHLAYERSSEMRKIAGIVKDINDQLKLISINAMIEAAHAGELGRGFSVVAQEVRKLSDSSYDQIKRVNESISFLMDHMAKATKAVSPIGHDLQQQTLSSNDIHEAIADVAVSIGKLKEILDAKLEIR